MIKKTLGRVEYNIRSIEVTQNQRSNWLNEGLFGRKDSLH